MKIYVICVVILWHVKSNDDSDIMGLKDILDILSEDV